MAMIAAQPAALVTAIVVTPRILSHNVFDSQTPPAAHPLEAAANCPAASVPRLLLTCIPCTFLLMLIGCPGQGGVTAVM